MLKPWWISTEIFMHFPTKPIQEQREWIQLLSFDSCLVFREQFLRFSMIFSAVEALKGREHMGGPWWNLKPRPVGQWHSVGNQDAVPVEYLQVVNNYSHPHPHYPTYLNENQHIWQQQLIWHENQWYIKPGELFDLHTTFEIIYFNMYRFMKSGFWKTQKLWGQGEWWWNGPRKSIHSHDFIWI
jgi:hypothetical protein